MVLKVGDTFFSRDGRPGVVTGRDQNTDRLKVEQQGENFEKSRRYGFINGLSAADRKEFEAVLDEAKQSGSVHERMEKIRTKIEEFQMDGKKQVLNRYLEGELSHLMYSASIHPQVYMVDEDKT